MKRSGAPVALTAMASPPTASEMSMRILRIAVLIVLFLSVTPVVAEAQFGLATVSCGDMITTDVTLDHDLVDCQKQRHRDRC